MCLKLTSAYEYGIYKKTLAKKNKEQTFFSFYSILLGKKKTNYFFALNIEDSQSDWMTFPKKEK